MDKALSDDLKTFDRLLKSVSRQTGRNAPGFAGEAYLAFCRARERFDPARCVPLAGYLHRRVAGAMIDAWQRETRRVPRDYKGTLRDSPRPDQIAATRELVGSLLRSLHGRDRLLIRLHYFEGMPLQDVALTFGVSAPRISVLHARALQHLRQRLETSQRQKKNARGVIAAGI